VKRHFFTLFFSTMKDKETKEKKKSEGRLFQEKGKEEITCLGCTRPIRLPLLATTGSAGEERGRGKGKKKRRVKLFGRRESKSG